MTWAVTENPRPIGATRSEDIAATSRGCSINSTSMPPSSAVTAMEYRSGWMIDAEPLHRARPDRRRDPRPGPLVGDSCDDSDGPGAAESVSPSDHAAVGPAAVTGACGPGHRPPQESAADTPLLDGGRRSHRCSGKCSRSEAMGSSSRGVGPTSIATPGKRGRNNFSRLGLGTRRCHPSPGQAAAGSAPRRRPARTWHPGHADFPGPA